MTPAVAALVGAVLGVATGVGTHRLNFAFTASEPDADGAPLPAERAWAPLLDGVIMAALMYRFGLTFHGLFAAAAVALLVQVLVFDARHRLILNRVVYPAAAAVLLLAPVSPLLQGNLQARLFAAVSGAVLLGVLGTIVVIASRGGVGLGDAKLIFVVGGLLGILPGSRAVFLGVLLGGLVALVLVVTRLRGMKDYIPYGPFLCAGGLAGLVFPCGLFGPVACS